MKKTRTGLELELEKVAIIVMCSMLPLEASRRDSISNLTSLGLRIRAADKPNAVLFKVAVGRHVNAV